MNIATLTVAAVLLAAPVAAFADDLDTAFQNLKDAEANKDAEQVKKLAGEACALARQAIKAPAPQAADEKENFDKHVAYAKEVEAYTEYALYATAVQSTPATMIDLIAALETQSPKSKYLDQAYPYYIMALGQTGGSSKIVGVAEKGLANFPENEDLLFIMTNAAQARKQNDRALTYANRLTAVMSRHGKPEGLSAGDWDRKKATMLGRGYYIAGIITAEKGQYAFADKNLRAALPYIRTDQTMAPYALYYLGIANYNLGKSTLNKKRVLEGASFCDEAAKFESQIQAQAYRDAHLIRKEGDALR